MQLTSISKKELVSQPGVFLTLRKMTEGRRIQLHSELQGALRKQEDLMVECRAAANTHDMLVREMKHTGQEPGEEYAQAKRKFDRAWEEYSSVQPDLIDPIYIEWGLKSVADADGQPVYVDDEIVLPGNFTELMPRAAYEEALKLVKEAAGLTEQEEKNSGSPTTSSAVDGDSKSNTTAPTAE